MHFTDNSQGLTAPHTRAQADQSVHQDANNEIDDDSAIEPSAGSDSKKLARHLSVAYNRLGQPALRISHARAKL